MKTIRFFLPVCLSVVLFSNTAAAADCNLNGVEDSTDLSALSSQDCNHNSIPDECDVSTKGFSTGTYTEFDVAVANAPVLSPLYLVPTHTADFNNDGHPDLWGRSGQFLLGGPITFLFVYLNQGNDTFSSPQTFQYAGVSGFQSESISDVQTTDVDGDGDLDILYRDDIVTWRGTPSASYSVSALINDGTGHFAVQSTNISTLLPRSLSGNYTKLRPAPLANGTSHDLVMLHEGHLYALYRTTGLNYVSFDMGLATDATNLVVLPNLYSIVSIYAFNNEKTIAEIYGPGDGSLQRAAYPDLNISGQEIISANLHTVDSSPVPIRLIPGSTVRNTSTGSTSVALEGFSGLFNFNLLIYSVDVQNVRDLQTPVDFDNDGDLDIPLFGDSAGALLLNDGNGLFSRKQKLFLPSTTEKPIALADFNGDSKPDFLVKSKTAGKFGILLNSSTYPLLTATSLDKNSNTIPDECEQAAILDFDGDKQSDVSIVRTFAGNYYWFTVPTSNPIFDLNPSPTVLGTSLDTILAGDFDGDGKVTPGIVSNQNGTLRWTTVNADLSRTSVDFGLTGDTPLTGYFDGDLLLDRVVVRNQAGSLVWFAQTEANGAGSYVTATLGVVGDTPFTADLDGDGYSEFIVAHKQSDGQILWSSYSPKISLAGENVLFGLSGDKLLPPTDMDGDGKADYVVTRSINGLLNTFVRRSSDVPVFSPPVEQIAFGLPGDEIYLRTTSRLPHAELATRRAIDDSFYSSFFNRMGTSGTLNSLLGFFGFSSDSLLGSDGKIVSKYGNVGGLFCTTMLPKTFSESGYSWNPGTKKPKYTIPVSLRSSVQSVSIYSPLGVRVDTMKAKRSRRNEFSGKKLSAAKLQTILNYSPAVVQTVLKNGQAICQQIYFPTSPN